MDPTLQQAPGQQAMLASGADPTSQALQNALMLQAIKAGATSGGAPPAGATAAAMGPPPGAMAPPPMQPTDPSAMPGGLAGQQQMMAGMGQVPTSQANPVAAALMSQIPGAQ
jgi:hypothetical protein